MEASRAILHGRDVFVRMSTGSGKSLCIFLAPLCRSEEAMAVVISPLNGLMDQHVCKHPLHSANKCQLPNLGLTTTGCGCYSCTLGWLLHV